jgi:hypothetical protein
MVAGLADAHAVLDELRSLLGLWFGRSALGRLARRVAGLAGCITTFFPWKDHASLQCFRNG